MNTFHTIFTQLLRTPFKLQHFPIILTGYLTSCSYYTVRSIKKSNRIGRKKKPRHQKGPSSRSRTPWKMGQEASQPINPDTPTETLSDRSLEAVAEFINDGDSLNVVVMTGAGISTAAGSMLFSHYMADKWHIRAT